MAPRGLTQEEKELQKNNLLQEGVELLLRYGIKKISVEDITKAAGVAKGSFYNSFQSKEEFALAVVDKIQLRLYTQVNEMLKVGARKDKVRSVANFMRDAFFMKEFQFMMENHSELIDLISKYPKEEMRKYVLDEAHMIRLILEKLDVPKSVDYKVVYTYIHAMYFGLLTKNVLLDESVETTLNIMIDGLIRYIFGGENEPIHSS